MIQRVFKVSDDMRRNCYYVANSAVGNAEHIYYLLQDQVHKFKHILFADVVNGGVRGFLVGHMATSGGIVDDLYVDRKFQRNGIGGQLLKAYENYCANLGLKQINLQTRMTQQALNFYAKAGFVRQGFGHHMQKSL